MVREDMFSCYCLKQMPIISKQTKKANYSTSFFLSVSCFYLSWNLFRIFVLSFILSYVRYTGRVLKLLEIKVDT